MGKPQTQRRRWLGRYEAKAAAAWIEGELGMTEKWACGDARLAESGNCGLESRLMSVQDPGKSAGKVGNVFRCLVCTMRHKYQRPQLCLPDDSTPESKSTWLLLPWYGTLVGAEIESIRGAETAGFMTDTGNLP